jgi:hypothetical protein
MEASMLGELVYQGNGKRLVRRVLSSTPLSVEATFEEDGKILGVDCKEIATYTAGARPDGTLYGEGHGILMTNQGDQIAWKGSGVGGFKEGGTVTYRGAIYYQTASAKMLRLNSVAGVFEFESTAGGDTHSKVWEWK